MLIFQMFNFSIKVVVLHRRLRDPAGQQSVGACPSVNSTGVATRDDVQGLGVGRGRRRERTVVVAMGAEQIRARAQLVAAVASASLRSHRDRERRRRLLRRLPRRALAPLDARGRGRAR